MEQIYTPWEQYQRGEISINEYLEKVLGIESPPKVTSSWPLGEECGWYDHTHEVCTCYLMKQPCLITKCYCD